MFNGALAHLGNCRIMCCPFRRYIAVNLRRTKIAPSEHLTTCENGGIKINQRFHNWCYEEVLWYNIIKLVFAATLPSGLKGCCMTHPENDDLDRYVHGQVATQTAVRIDQLGVITRVDEVCDFMIDTHTHQLVQVGGEGVIAVDQIDFIKQVLEMTDEQISALAEQATQSDDDTNGPHPS